MSTILLKELDLEPIIVKIIDKNEGLGWSLEYTKFIETEYRKFLLLCQENKDASIVPPADVDKFWHYHILDTLKYAQDCENLFGYFLHHFPYFGMRGEEDFKNLNKSWEETCVLHEKRFGKPSEYIKENLWKTIARCPNCGRRSPSNVFSLKRPTLASISA